MEKTHDIFDGLLTEVMAKETFAQPVPEHVSSGLAQEELALVVERGAARLSKEAKQRLASCPHCRDLIAVTSQAITEWKEEEKRRAVGEKEVEQKRLARKDRGSTARLKAVLQWASDGLRFVCGSVGPHPLQMQPVAVRDSSSDLARVCREPAYREFRAMLGPNQIQLQVERLPSQLMDLQVRIVQGGKAYRPFRATLLRNGRVSESVPFENGLACFRDLKPESYILQVTSRQEVVGWVDLILFD